jgi:anaerobic selenocysteine-containing dehydrogenase
MAIQLKTVCNRDCPDACAIVATVEDGRVTRLAGDPAHPVTRGALCYRTSRFLSRQYSPERLTSPMLRDGDAWRAIGWDEALDLAAAKLVAIRAESGPAAIFHYRSGGSLGMLKHLTELFFERFGPVTVKRGDICSGAGDAAQMMDFGEEDSHDLFDLLNSRNILLWGKNAYVSSPHTVPVLRDAKARGAKLALVDPVHQKTAHLCEAYWQPRAGGDVALAMGVARVLFERGWTDPRAGEYCDHFDAFRSLAMSRTVAAWCAEADVDAAAAEDLAWRLGPGKPTAILVGWGMGRRSNGGAIVRALDALGAISGNIGIPGGGVSFYFKRRGAFDVSFVKGEAARTVCEPLFGPEVLGMNEPPIRAVWVTAGNPVVMLPESETVERALRSREFVVVVDSFMTDTARCAHLVLPTTTLLEDDDLLGSYGHHWIGASRPVVAAPPGVRSDLEIMQGLASRVGLESVMAGSAREWKQRMVGPKLGPVGMTLEQLEAGPVRNPLAAQVLFTERRFATESGKVNLMHDVPGAREVAPEGYPLQLLALSTEKAQSSQWAREVEGPLEVTVHPDAAAGFGDGDVARLESRVGSMPVRVRLDARQRRDVALVAKGGHLAARRCANSLVRARLTDIGDGGALYEEFVRIVAVR